MSRFSDVELIRVLQSLLPMSQDGKAISGATLVDDREVDLTDITYCIRANFKLLGAYEGRSRLISVDDWRTDNSVSRI